MKKKLRITYNAPVTLTFAIICALILLLNEFLLGSHLVPALFTAPGRMGSEGGFNWHSVLDYVRLFTHVFGHSDWNHFLGNFSFILLLGPLMEERYGSEMVLLMFVVTAFVTGVINACLIPRPLLGASGIVFMLIVLASITTLDRNVVPLSFVFVVALYLSRELVSVPQAAHISTVAHIAGGLCGSLFGFLVAPKSRRVSKKEIVRQKMQNQMEESAPISVEKFQSRKSTGIPVPKKSVVSEHNSTVIGTIEL